MQPRVPQVSVLMTVYNGMPYLVEAVDSVRRQTLDDWELIIVDDGSTDDTAPWLDRLPSEIVFEHVYLTTQPMEEPDRPEHLHMMVQMFPADRMLLFSSDFPHWDGDTPDFAARHFPASLRDGVMYKTARTLYRLPAIEHG